MYNAKWQHLTLTNVKVLLVELHIIFAGLICNSQNQIKKKLEKQHEKTYMKHGSES